MAEHQNPFPVVLRDPPLSQGIEHSPMSQESDQPQNTSDSEASILSDPEHPTELEKEQQPLNFVKDELTRQLQDAKIRFDQELAEMLSAKERELLNQFELKMDANNLSWEAKLKDCLEDCRLELAEKHGLEIEQIKVVHSEEMENALKANRITHQAQLEAIKELHQVEYDSTVQECEALRKQLTEQMTSLEIGNKKIHQQEIEKMLAEFEDSRKASHTEKQKEIELLLDHIKRLEEQVNKQVSTEGMAVASYKQALQEKEMKIQAYHQSQLALLKAVHSQTENTLRVDYESKITALESELESIECEVADNKSELEETHYQQILAIEAQQKDKVAAIQTHCERRLLEAQAIHAKEFENLQKKYLQKEDELLLAHEQNAKQLLRSHKLEKDELIVQHKAEMSDPPLTHSEPRLKALKVFSSPRPQSAGDTHTSRSRPRMRDEDLVDVVQSESTLFSPSKIQRIRDRFSRQREQALTDQREKTPPPKSPQKRSIRSDSPSKLKSEYELKLTKLEEKMVTERKTQVDLLKKKHERDLAEMEKKYRSERVELETKIRAQLEDEHFRHTEQAVAECLVDKDRGMDVTRQELELTHQKQLSELKLSHEAELRRINTEHCLKLETLTGDRKEKSTSMDLDAIKGQYSTELELQAAHYNTEIESLQMQISSLKSEQGLKMNELREQLKQDHMAKFKVMTNKLQQLHEGEVNALRQENVDLVSSHEYNMQMLRGELDSEREREIAGIVEVHKNEMKTIQEKCEEQLAQQEAQDDQSDQLELNVRQELSRLNNDLETKLQQLETERQQCTERETALTEQYREREAALNKQLQELVAERQQYREREAALTEQYTEREAALTEQYRQREEALNKQLQELVTERQQYREREAALNKQLQELVAERQHYREREAALTEQYTEREAALTEQYRERETALNKQLQELVAERQHYREREAALTEQYTEREAALTEQYTERETALTEQYREREAALTEQLQTERQLREAEDNETKGDKERLTAEIRTLYAERDLLRSTVTALYAAVSNCLELSTVVQSVLGHTHPDGLGVSHSNHEDIESRLSERLIAQQVVSPSDSDSSHSPVSTPIQPHTLHTPHSLIAAHSTATDSGTSLKQSSDWTLMKLTPSVDSGIISQQASALQSEASTLVDTPSNMTGTTPLSEGMSILSIIPLDATAPFTSHTHSTSEDFDDTAHSFLSVSLMTPTGSPTHTVGGPDTITLGGHDNTQQSLSDQPLIDLSVIPLDSSTVFMTSSLSADHNATIPLDAAIPNHSPPPSTNRSGAVPMDSAHHMEWASNGQAGFVLPDLSLLHSQLTVFHGSVSNLVQQYATLVSQVEDKSGDSQALVTQLQSQLDISHRHLQGRLESAEDSPKESQAGDSEALVTQLQSQLDTMRQFHGQLQGQLEDSRRDGEGEVVHLKREVAETREQLDAALDKIKTLVQQLEGCDDRLEQELADERRENRESLTARESREEGLMAQLSASEKQLSEKERILEELSAERTSLTDKVKEVCCTMEEKETALLQSSTDALQLRQENQALKQVNRQLRERQEQADFKRCSTEEKLIEQKSVYESQLKQMQEELSELLDIRDRISAREEELENLLLEKEDLMNRLSIAEHQLATQAEQGRVEGQVGEKEQRLLTQLESQGELCETLRARLQETQSSHEVIQQQYVQSSTARTQLQTELQQLRQELQRRESLVTNTLAEKAALEGRVQSCQEELEAVKEELRMATEQHLETASESQASTMSGNLGVQDDASQEGEGLSVGVGVGRQSAVEEVRAQLETRLAALEQELRDNDQQQVVSELTGKLSLESRLKDSLQQEVAALRDDIERGQRSQEQVLAEVESKHEQEVQTIVTEHAQKLKELQLAHLEALHRQRAEVDAKHTGERAFIRLHHQEQLNDLQTRHREEIEQLSSEHHSLLLSLDNAGGTDDITDVGSHSLLLKIAKLAPALAREAQEVNELCKLTRQRMSTVGVDQPDSSGQASSLEALVERLREVVQDIGAAKDTSGVEDWRRDLLAAVGGLLEHQRGILATTLSASTLQGEEDSTEVQQMLQDQLSQHSALVQQLHSADRESLLAEILALRATLESMRNEQRQQNRDLLAQLQANSHHPTDTTLLQHQLQSALAKLSLLEQELANIKQELADKITETGNKTHELEQKSREIAKKDRQFATKDQEFERVLRSFNEAEDSKRRAEEEVGVTRQKVVEMEGALSIAMSELGALKQELIVLRGIETTLRAECSREKASSAQLRGSLLGEKTINQQLASQVEQLNGRVNERAKQASEASQAMAVQLQAQLDEANEAIEHLKQEKITETDGVSGLEHELATLRSVLQAKEEQLTQTTDKMLQDKITLDYRCSFHSPLKFRNYQENLTPQVDGNSVWCDCDVTFPGEHFDRQRSIDNDFRGICTLSIFRCSSNFQAY